jgi:hypothetical protein
VVRERLLRRGVGVRVRRAQMYKRRLLSFFAYLLGCTCTNTKRNEKERKKRKAEKKRKKREEQPFNMRNID